MKPVRQLFRYLKPHRWAIVLTWAMSSVVLGLQAFSAWIGAGFIDLPEALIDVAMFSRVDPKGLAERGAEGTVVRIGLDRALYGYRGVPADRAAAFDERSLIRLRFTLESGRRGQVLLRLPDPG